MPRLPPLPELDWTPEEAPRAAGFDDVYFSREGGLAESEAVFLAGCGLPQAWAGRPRFAICELGFGAGLNALAVWRAWKATRAPSAILHMCSIEAFPLERVDAARAHATFPEIRECSEQLLASWPVRAAGPQRLWFAEDGFALTVFHGRAEAVLAGMSGTFDAFFLDGFAPSRNQDMWTPAVFSALRRLAAPGARAATFTVAGEVRRGLEAVGFVVEKRPGFGRKRERLEAVCRGPAAPRATPYPYGRSDPHRVAIVGAGIAGATAAHALARRGVEAVVLDAGAALGAGGSGNPAALVMPRLDRGGVLRTFFVAAFLDAVALYQQLGVFTPCGVVEMRRDGEAQADLLADPPLPAAWFSGAPGGGALHARAGLVDARAALARLLSEAVLKLNAPVAGLEALSDKWRLLGPDGRGVIDADAVVLACGAGLQRLAQSAFLPLELTRGQVEWGRTAAPLTQALTHGTYVAPLGKDVLFGATFDRLENDHDSGSAGASARARNLAALAELAPDIAAGVDVATLSSRASVRAATPDRAPIAGALPDAPRWLAHFAPLATGAHPPGGVSPAYPGLYVLGGLGARGFTHAPILGERIATEMFGEPQALSWRELEALHPCRFLLRAVKRGSAG